MTQSRVPERFARQELICPWSYGSRRGRRPAAFDSIRRLPIALPSGNQRTGQPMGWIVQGRNGSVEQWVRVMAMDGESTGEAAQPEGNGPARVPRLLAHRRHWPSVTLSQGSGGRLLSTESCVFFPSFIHYFSLFLDSQAVLHEQKSNKSPSDMCRSCAACVQCAD